MIILFKLVRIHHSMCGIHWGFSDSAGALCVLQVILMKLKVCQQTEKAHEFNMFKYNSICILELNRSEVAKEVICQRSWRATTKERRLYWARWTMA